MQNAETAASGSVDDQGGSVVPSRTDVRSRDAFEANQLGEAVLNLQRDLRGLRLEKEDLRFDRDRYRASAADYQAKLTKALLELDTLRGYREQAAQSRHDVVKLSKEFKDRVAQESAVLTASLQAQYDDRLCREIVSLARECGDRSVDQQIKPERLSLK